MLCIAGPASSICCCMSACAVVNCMATCAGKTLEVRRSEAAAARGRPLNQADLERLWLSSMLDRHRPRINLPPLPSPVPPPPPPSQCACSVSSRCPPCLIAVRPQRSQSPGTDADLMRTMESIS